MGKGAYIIAFVVSLALSLALVIAHPLAARAMGTAYLPEQSELFNKALAQIGLSPDDVRFNNADLNMWGGDKYRLNVHRFLFDNPWKTSAYTRALSNGLLKQVGNLPSLITSAHGKLDAGVRLGLTGDPLEATKKRIEELGDKALAEALAGISGKPADMYLTKEYDRCRRWRARPLRSFCSPCPMRCATATWGLRSRYSSSGLTPSRFIAKCWTIR